MSRTTILYKDVAPGAAENTSVSASGALDGADPSRLPKGVPERAAVTGELNAWGLNGTYRTVEPGRLAFWSSELSGEDGTFAEPPVIIVELGQLYSSTGITLVFDQAASDYCTAVNIKWYHGDTLQADMDFAPDAALYFCACGVSGYDRAVITLLETKLPFRRARLNQILFGVCRSFGMEEIREASISADTDLLSAELPVSTMRWKLNNREDVDYMFQLKQPVEVWSDGTLICVYYIDGSSRTAKNLYDISCHDAFGVLDEAPFPGGVYNGRSAKSLLEEILDGAFPLVCEAADTVLTGAILPCTRREAVQQVLFAWGACASAFGSDGIRVFSPGAAPEEIGLDRTFPGVSTDLEAVVTEVRVTAHTYTRDSGGSIQIGGARYTDAETVYAVENPNATAADKQNVVEVTGATLVSEDIGRAAAQRVYDHYARRSTHKAKLVWKGERPGDCVTVPNAWGGTVTGNITRMGISLSNTIVADCETVEG